MRLDDIYRPDRMVLRFWRKVDRSGDCWLWTASRAAGYGYFSVCIDGHVTGTYAHRISYMLEHGEVPDDLQVCHDCDEHYPIGDLTYRLCVNPAHLFVGTAKENSRDAHNKGRVRHTPMRGEDNPRSILKVAIVRDIRRRVAAGVLQTDLAREYGVALSTIHAALTGVNWADVE